MRTNLLEWKEFAEMTLKQKKVTDKMSQEFLSEIDKFERMLSNFSLQHLNDNEIVELFGFVPYIWWDDIDIFKKKSEIFLTYNVCKSEEDYQNCNIQKITLPLSTIEKYIVVSVNEQEAEKYTTKFKIKGIDFILYNN